MELSAFSRVPTTKEGVYYTRLCITAPTFNKLVDKINTSYSKCRIVTVVKTENDCIKAILEIEQYVEPPSKPLLEEIKNVKKESPKIIEDGGPQFEDYLNSKKIFDLRKPIKKDDYVITDLNNQLKLKSGEKIATYYHFPKQFIATLNHITIKATEFVGLYIKDYYYSNDSTWERTGIRFILIDENGKIKFEETVYRSYPFNSKATKKIEKEKNDNIKNFKNNFNMHDLLVFKTDTNNETLYLLYEMIDHIELEKPDNKRDDALFLINGSKLIISHELSRIIVKSMKLWKLPLKVIE